jgi:predicted nuclease of predicted toxin-antitoxin system
MLDEMFSPRIAQLLRRSGIDCACVADDRLLCAQDDATVLAAALEQGRVLVTNNVIDFEPLRRNRIALDQPVPQLIYTDDATFPRRRNYVGQLAAALADAASSHLVSVYGGVLWLTPPRGQ